MRTTYAALLRGINVGGSKKVPMAELRALIQDIGYGAVRTHLNSGNAVFTAGGTAAETVAELEKAIEAHFGFQVPCLVRDTAGLRAVVEANPFPEGTFEGNRLHVTFLSERIGEGWFASVDPEAYAPDEFRLGVSEFYLHTPNGVGRSKLAEVLSRPSAVPKGVTATTRNWNTVTALLRLTEETA
ncbi:DUF1697 domain-containing protein [Streptomyces sp. GC420]|uniref:DUF1697 domain-containing protein n=1 Tax=Streptomyces sp. GC420 TaxID=2697568 RepID=UPI001414D2EB|nr:DUF1697 domain-containing protein [Streptomyces sp. GC420]NBM18072.1 DUF1697 domain-containing protein [Streptomyces sp. GC420]